MSRSRVYIYHVWSWTEDKLLANSPWDPLRSNSATNPLFCSRSRTHWHWLLLWVWHIPVRYKTFSVKVKVVYSFKGTPSHSYGMSLAIWDHTCHLTQVNTPRLNPSQTGRHSIYLPRRDGRLSWPRWLVTYRDGSPACRWSPIQVLTWPIVN